MIKIEVLYPEVANLYGDIFNIKLLEQSIDDVKIIKTDLTTRPAFVNEDIDLIYMGPTTEKMQENIVGLLKPYRDRLKELMNKNKIFLFTGNAFEIFGKYIENEDGSKVECLDLIDFYSKRDMMGRFHCLFLGSINDDKNNDLKIVGFRAQFSTAYTDDESKLGAFKVEKGFGINTKSKFEGIRKNNFFGTYLLGPILVMNPLFAKYIMRLLKVNDTLAFEDEAMYAYKLRLEEFEGLKDNQFKAIH